MPVVNLTNEKLAAHDVVRSNRTSMANAVAKYADARYGNRVSWNVLARRHKHLRRSRHDTAIRNLWRAIHRNGIVLSRAQPSETAGRFLPRELFPANFSQVRWRSLRRRADSRNRSQRILPVSNRHGNHPLYPKTVSRQVRLEATALRI